MRGLADSTLRAIALKTLSRNKELSARRLYEIVRSENSNVVTYPAIYKTLNVMTNEGKLLKNRREFTINMDWVTDVKNFVLDIEATNAGKDRVPFLDDIQENEIYNIKCQSLEDAEKIRKRIQANWVEKKRSYPYIGIYKHLRTPIVYHEKAMVIASHVTKQKKKAFVLISNNTALDRWCSKFYTRHKGMNVRLGTTVTGAESTELIVLGDTIIQLHMSKNVEDYIDKLYRKINRIDQINTKEFYENVYKAQNPIRITMFKNSMLAKNLTDQVLKKFRV